MGQRAAAAERLGGVPRLPAAASRLRRHPPATADPACVGPIAVQDTGPVQADIRHFQAAVAAHSPADAFMNAASPGVIALFQPNRHYPIPRSLSVRLGRRHGRGVPAITRLGWCCKSTPRT